MGKPTDGHEYFVVNWKKSVNTLGAASHTILEESDILQEEDLGKLMNPLIFLKSQICNKRRNLWKLMNLLIFLKSQTSLVFAFKMAVAFCPQMKILSLFETLFPKKPRNFSKKRN